MRINISKFITGFAIIAFAAIIWTGLSGGGWRLTPQAMQELFGSNSYCITSGPSNKPVNIGLIYFKGQGFATDALSWQLLSKLSVLPQQHKMKFGEACNRTIYLWKQFLGLK